MDSDRQLSLAANQNVVGETVDIFVDGIFNKVVKVASDNQWVASLSDLSAGSHEIQARGPSGTPVSGIWRLAVIRERHEDLDSTASVILMPGENIQTSTMTILNEGPTGTVAIQPYNKDMQYDPIPGKYEGQVLHVNFHALASNEQSVVITLKVPCSELSFWHYLHGSPSTKVTCISEDGSQSQQVLGDSNDSPLQVRFSGARISRLQISGISASEWFVIDHFEFS